MSNVFIRPLRMDEWEAFSRVRLEGLKAHPGLFASTYESEVQQTPEQWQDWLTQDKKCVFGLFDANKLIGVTAVFTKREDPSGTTGIMAASYIKPEYRKMGLSRLMYEARIVWALKHLPWKKLIISHRVGNEPSRKAMLRAGFVYTHTSSRQFPDGATADELNYEMDLEATRSFLPG